MSADIHDPQRIELPDVCDLVTPEGQIYTPSNQIHPHLLDGLELDLDKYWTDCYAPLSRNHNTVTPPRP